MAGSRFWRLQVDRVNGGTGGYAAISRVALHAADDGRALPATVTASATAAGAPQDVLAIAGGAGWQSPSGLPQWLDFDLGGEMALRSLSFFGINWIYDRWRVRSSDDGVLWSDASVFDAPGMTATNVPMAAALEPWRAAAGARAAWRPGDAAAPVHVAGVGAAFTRRAAGGRRTVFGVTKVSVDGVVSVVGARRVRLYDRASGELVAETFSDPVTGRYAFTGLADVLVFVVAHDDPVVHNAAIRDALRPQADP